MALAGGILLLTSGAASAAVVTTDLNLRSGPGTDYPIINAMPAGSQVRVFNCTGSWCRVGWQGERGWASSSYLSGGRGYAAGDYYAAPSVVYGEPSYAYVGSGYWGPGWGYAYEPGFSIGFGFGGGWHHGWHHWHHP